MRVAAAVVLCVALIAGAWAADEESVTEDFAVNEQAASVVQSLAVAMNPDNVVRATIVKHLPSHDAAAEDAEAEESEQQDMPLGNAFETSNWEADQVAAADTLEATSFVEADAAEEDEAEAEEADAEEDSADDEAEADEEEDLALLEVADEDEEEEADSDESEDESEDEESDESEAEESEEEVALVEADAETSAPSFGPNAKAVKAAAAVDVPDMTTAPLGKPTNANTDPTLQETAVEKALRTPVMDQAAIKASHLYIGYEDPKSLPDGTELKRPVDTSGTIGTEAGTAFNYAKGQTPKSKKCSNGCQVRLPVMVGYRGVREDPAESTRRVTVPGDRERHRRIHQDFKTGEKWVWNKADLAAADKHVKGVAWRLNKLRIKRKAYEDTALNREVRVPDNAAGIATL